MLVGVVRAIMARMRVTVIGCAGTFPGPDSPASCYLLEAEGFRLVIDMGNGALGVLQRHADLFGIDAICVSHLHYDHCADLAAYWVARQVAPQGPRPVIPVYGPPGTARLAKPDLGPGSDGIGGGPDGQLRFDIRALEPGSFAFGPKGVPHTFIGETDGAKALIGFQPFQFEGFLHEVGEPATERVLPPRLEAPPDMERLLPIAERNGMVILGPPGPPPGHD